jgi:hypothetical protein
MILTIIGFIVVCLAGLYVTSAAVGCWSVASHFGTGPLAIVFTVVAVAIWTLAWWLSPFSITVAVP